MSEKVFPKENFLFLFWGPQEVLRLLHQQRQALLVKSDMKVWSVVVGPTLGRAGVLGAVEFPVLVWCYS